MVGAPSVRSNPRRLGLPYDGHVATYRGRERCRERIEKLARSGESGEALQREAIWELGREIGFDRVLSVECRLRGEPAQAVPDCGRYLRGLVG